MKIDKRMKNLIMFVQIILTLFGTILAVVLLIKTLASPSFLGVLGSIAYLIAHIAIIIYCINNYNKKEDIYYQIVTYTYISIIGIQILQSGNFMSDYGLTQSTAILINCCNLISFANIIKFVDNLNNSRKAFSYIIIAVILKLIVEVCLIVKMIRFIQLIHILMSLSIPILGVTLIVTYIYRIRRFPINNK